MSKQLLKITVLVAAGFLCAGIPQVWAQSDEERRRERIERQEELKSSEEFLGAGGGSMTGFTKRFGLLMDYGGTVRYTYTGGDDGAHDRNRPLDSQEFSKDYDLNAFLNMVNLKRTTKFYTRLRTTYTERKKNAGTTLGNEWKELEVDLMFVERKFRAGSSRTTLTFGRQFVSVGRGIAYAQTADGVNVNLTQDKLNLSGFAVIADRSPDDIDPGNLSPPSRSHTHRDFYGGQVQYNLKKIRPYLYYVQTDDHSGRRLDPFTAEVHIYQPRFVGYGASGNVIERLTYFGEFITADGYTTSSTGNTGGFTDTYPVDAGAWDVGITWAVPGPYRIILSAEQAWGSGDPDRVSTANSTNLGNRVGPDEAFRPFGGLSLGYALAPTLVNLKVKKYGLAISPFDRSAIVHLKSVRLTSEFYRYWKDQAKGPTSDLVANFANDDPLDNEDIGKEINAQLSWSPFNDMRLNVRWGKFVPGKAYGEVGNDLVDPAIRVRKYTGAPPEIYWKILWSLDI